METIAAHHSAVVATQRPARASACGEAVTERLTVPAGKGLALRLATGNLLRVTNTSGVQVRFSWSFDASTAGARAGRQLDLSTASAIVSLTLVAATAATRRCATSGALAQPLRRRTACCGRPCLWLTLTTL